MLKASTSSLLWKLPVMATVALVWVEAAVSLSVMPLSTVTALPVPEL
ncbi:hypothetical protein [Chromobacterium violaceum]|nr:hypothetical protein [Chromobacterium violaceum]